MRDCFVHTFPGGLIELELITEENVSDIEQISLVLEAFEELTNVVEPLEQIYKLVAAIENFYFSIVDLSPIHHFHTGIFESKIYQKI